VAHDYDAVIVGAGAAGLAAAIFAARMRPGLRLALVDGARTLGAKILVSGGGRCNLTNATVTERDFNGGHRAAIRHVLRALPVDATLGWFADLGVRVHEEAGGKLFPDSSRARTVLDALVGEARAAGVPILAGHRVDGITRDVDGFSVSTPAGEITCRAVVLATGGLSLPKSGSDGVGYRLAAALGHSLVATTPALVPLVTGGGLHSVLQGVSHEVTLTVATPGRKPLRVDGPLLWTHFGVSGPAVLDASRHWLRRRLESAPVSLTVCTHPFLDFDVAETWLRQQAAARPRAHVNNALASVLPETLAYAMTAMSGLAEGTSLALLTRDERRRLSHQLSALPLDVVDSRGYTHAEVTAGGVPLDEVDPATMMSRRCPGLFLAGEMLDVDGRLGGFNFQWAWASARLAARGVAGWT
jgi:hypothetical protein